MTTSTAGSYVPPLSAGDGSEATPRTSALRLAIRSRGDMDRSGAAPEGRPAHRYPGGAQSLPGVDGEVAAPAPPTSASEHAALDERWQGGVFVPDELLPLVAAA